MGDAKLFCLTCGKAEELTGRAVRLENNLRNLHRANEEEV